MLPGFWERLNLTALWQGSKREARKHRKQRKQAISTTEGAEKKKIPRPVPRIRDRGSG